MVQSHKVWKLKVHKYLSQVADPEKNGSILCWDLGDCDSRKYGMSWAELVDPQLKTLLDWLWNVLSSYCISMPEYIFFWLGPHMKSCMDSVANLMAS